GLSPRFVQKPVRTSAKHRPRPACHWFAWPVPLPASAIPMPCSNHQAFQPSVLHPASRATQHSDSPCRALPLLPVLPLSSALERPNALQPFSFPPPSGGFPEPQWVLAPEHPLP